MNVVCIAPCTYVKHLKRFLEPTVFHGWKINQEDILLKLSSMEGGLILGGDGRSDSPGHCAKYGSYSVLEERINKVIDVQLVQSNEVANSVAMEKEGLIRSITFLKEAGFVPSVIITDRHPQIQKWIRENLTETTHYYDVWHVAKGVKKKVTALSLKPGCEDIKAWIKSISNHLYWCGSSTRNGDQNVIVAKWKSLGNHIQNIHTDHGEHFNNCAHGDLGETARTKKWLQSDSKSCDQLVKLIENTRLCKDVRKLSPLHQTSNVEAFHSLITRFCPKLIAFSYKGMMCRLYLAAIHYNENSNRQACRNKDGKIAHVLRFPKCKKGGYTLRERKVPPTYGYIDNLMSMLCSTAVQNETEFSAALSALNVPSFLCSDYERPDIEEALAAHSSRFNDFNLI